MTNLDRRMELHQILCDLLGTAYVYFQPPESIKLHYPCILYERMTGDSQYADNKAYMFRICYRVTYIDKDPDNEVLTKLSNLPLCRMDRSYKGDNLNHDVFILYY